LNLERYKVWANYSSNLPDVHVVEYPILYKHIPLVIGKHDFSYNLIQFDLLEFHAILGIDCLTIHGVNIDCKEPSSHLEGPKGAKSMLQ